MRLEVYIQPGASRSELAGSHGGCVKIRIAAPPVDNAANRALIEFVAGRLGLPRRQVRLTAGLASRRKVLEIEGASAAQIAAAFAVEQAGGGH
jgi:hypothetical protein